MILQSEKPRSDERRNFTPSVLLVGSLVLMVGFLHLFMMQSTSEFRGIGVVWSLVSTVMLAFIVLPATVVMSWVVSYFQRHHCLPHWINGKFLILLGTGIGLLSFLFTLWSARPENRLMKATNGASEGARNIEVAGFRSFLAHRWLYAFDASEEDVARIVASLQLETREGVNLHESINRDIFFAESTSPAKAKIPGTNGSVAYGKNNTGSQGQSSRWVTLVFSASEKRAWLYMGYQN